MNRRQFTQVAALGGIGLCLTGKLRASAQPTRVAVTMDDFNWGANAVKLTGAERNQAILAALGSRSVKAALFVRGSNIEDDDGKKLLKAWDTEGHLIGNHSYSHWYYNDSKISAEAFEKDILRCEELLKTFPRFQKIF